MHPQHFKHSWTLSWMKSTPSRNPIQPPTSPMKTAPKPSYSQMTIQRPPEPTIKPGQQPTTKENLRACDPGKHPSCDLACDLSCDPAQDLSRDLTRDIPCDLTACDHRNLTHDLPRDWSSTRSPDRVRFRRAPHPLIHTWKTMGMING